MIVYNIFLHFNSLAKGVKILILKNIVINKAIFTLTYVICSMTIRDTRNIIEDGIIYPFE